MQPGAARFAIPTAPAEASPEGEAGKYHDLMVKTTYRWHIFEMFEIYSWPCVYLG